MIRGDGGAGMSEFTTESRATSEVKSDDASFAVARPRIEPPKGGGAIGGLGEKFAANPVTGTSTMSVPIAASPGRAGFGPSLSLSYDSGAGNGPFGLGWTLSLPAVARKTSKGCPRYLGDTEPDTFVLSGAEDLVPTLVESAGWGRHRQERDGFVIDRYRPRVEGLFARIERWTSTATGEAHWRSTTRDNVTSVYGLTQSSRIADPSNPRRVFSWLICQTYDDRGQAMLFDYDTEDSAGVERDRPHERWRSDQSRSANRYLRRVRYGNRRTILDEITGLPPNPDTIAAVEDWMFELVLDYGEGRIQGRPPLPGTPVEYQHRRVRARFHPDAGVTWQVRPDAFSSYRSGFDIRTYRRCERILMFHHFPDQLGRHDYLVRSTDFHYDDLDVDATTTVDDELVHQGSTRYDSVLRSVTQTSYVHRHDDEYIADSTPPVEFDYSQPVIGDVVTVADPATLEDLPRGVDGSDYRWLDLDGEGLPGIWTETGGASLYKRNLSPLTSSSGDGGASSIAAFSPADMVERLPSLAVMSNSSHQFLDLAGDGQLDVAWFDGPAVGFYERTEERGWEPFRTFASLPNIDWAAGGHVKFVDLTGDGHADILVIQDQHAWWHRSLGEEGYGPPEPLETPTDGPTGSRLMLAHHSDALFFADLSGDGLSDLALIRSGAVSYWPNLGHGRFGPKVEMDNPPLFDRPHRFDPRRLRLADIDGSGVTDLLYLGSDGIDLYLNQAGNGWSDRRPLHGVPPVDGLAAVSVVDLLGTGTACLVWSSPLPADAERPLRYVDLMGGLRGEGDDLVQGQKPHLLVRVRNNLGAATSIQYAPSTRFYLQDARDGRPWVTRLPFPVHCVERVTIDDRWQQTSFTSTYSYHHGYFDGIEREFRGFGRVDQRDQGHSAFIAANLESPSTTNDRALMQAPVKTITWYHTGAPISGADHLEQYRHEYFPRSLRADGPAPPTGLFEERRLPAPDLHPVDLPPDERREAMRACKGIALRTETYELDAGTLDDGFERPTKLFTVAQHNCHIRRLQPRGDAAEHAVFLVTESEAITYHHELDLTRDSLWPDPRIAHSLNLTVDDLGNVLQRVSAVYPRLGRHTDPNLPSETIDKIFEVQHQRHLAYVENVFTTDIDEPDTHRLRQPCETITAELTGIEPTGRYFTIDDLRRHRLNPELQPTGTPVRSLPYHQLATGTEPRRRDVDQVRTLFFGEELATPLPLGTRGRLGLVFETYRLALTNDLLAAVIGSDRLSSESLAVVRDPASSGYLTGPPLAARLAGHDTTGQYWIRSGIAGYGADAQRHFYLPETYTDPFDNTSFVSFDEDDLFIQTTIDALDNRTRVAAFDHRVLAPTAIEDPNRNRTEVVFDVLGQPAAIALTGKAGRAEGDDLSGFDDDLRYVDPGRRNQFFTRVLRQGHRARPARRRDQSTPVQLRHRAAPGRHDTVRTTRSGSRLIQTHPTCPRSSTQRRRRPPRLGRLLVRNRVLIGDKGTGRARGWWHRRSAPLARLRQDGAQQQGLSRPAVRAVLRRRRLRTPLSRARGEWCHTAPVLRRRRASCPDGAPRRHDQQRRRLPVAHHLP